MENPLFSTYSTTCNTIKLQNPEKKNIQRFSKPIEVVKAIISHSNGRLRLSGKKRKSYRVQLNNSNTETFLSDKDLQTLLENTNTQIVETIPPGCSKSDSSKYNTFLLQHGDILLSVVFGIGGNRGHDFESETIRKLEMHHEVAKKHGPLNGLYKTLLGTFGISPQDIDKIIHVGGKRVKRPLGNHPKNVGPIISDIDFELKNGSKIHISLKNKNGKTIANSGYFTGFVSKLVTNNGIQHLEFQPGSHPLDTFIVEGCGVDKHKVVQGLNDYIAQTTTTTPFKNISTKFDANIIKNYLASAYGYGYWYLRPKMISEGKGYHLIHLSSVADAMNKVGDVKNVLVNYPYWTVNGSSKQVTIKIHTTTGYYYVEIRNSQGKVHPNEIKIRLMKMLD